MGVVFRARDARLDRDVAIKALPEALRADSGRLRRFEQEARAAGALNHPNLLVVYDVGSHEGTPYLVTELLEGQTLRELLHAGPLTPRRAVDFALQVARGLAAAHDHGIVHRDIKPENVLVTAKDRVKLVDFGLAKAVGPTGKAPSDAPAGTLTESGAILGTAGYMSPEQVRGNGVDARSDLFAFGAVLYEMLTGEQAFEGATPVERSYAILRSEPRELGRLATRATPELAALVRRCLAKSPEERFASAHELVSALEGLAAELTTTGERPLARPTRESASARDERPKRARTALLVGLAAVLGAALAVGVTRSLEAPSVAASPAKAPEPETATVTRVTFRPAEIGGARFSSDGKRVIYDQRTFEHGTRIYESAIGGPSQRALNDTALRVFAVSKTGELAVGSRPEKSASAKGLMLSRLVPGGAPRDLTDGVLSAEWSPDGATLAIVRRTAAGARVELPIGTTLFETDGWISTLRFSPKGDTLAVLHHPIENDDRGTVELIRVDGSQTVLTEPFWSADGLAWLPSGEELWFAAAKQSGARAIYGVTLGGEVRRIYQAPGPLSLLDIDHEGRVLIRSDDPRSRMMAFSANDGRGVELSWFDASLPVSLSADGRMLLFMEGREAAGSEIQVFLRSTDGSPATHLGEGIAFALSPDARWALVSPKAPFGNLVLVPTGAGEPQELPPGNFAGVESAVFFPDGDRILFAAREQGRPSRFFTQRRSGGPPEPLTEEGLSGRPLLSPDGTRLVARNAEWQQVIVDVASKRTSVIEGLESGTHVVGWAPDGKSVHVVRKSPWDDALSKLPTIEVFDLATKSFERWDGLDHIPEVFGSIHRLVATPDGKHMVMEFHQNFAALHVLDGLR
jgi:dipeptidyl aminopeptidase/acylaminoacyl peptidase